MPRGQGLCCHGGCRPQPGRGMTGAWREGHAWVWSGQRRAVPGRPDPDREAVELGLVIRGPEVQLPPGPSSWWLLSRQDVLLLPGLAWTRGQCVFQGTGSSCDHSPVWCVLETHVLSACQVKLEGGFLPAGRVGEVGHGRRSPGAQGWRDTQWLHGLTSLESSRGLWDGGGGPGGGGGWL